MIDVVLGFAQVLARGGASAAAAAAAENAAGEAEERQAAASGPVQLDELGRDMNVMARREAEERAESRHARLQHSLPFLVCPFFTCTCSEACARQDHLRAKIIRFWTLNTTLAAIVIGHHAANRTAGLMFTGGQHAVRPVASSV